MPTSNYNTGFPNGVTIRNNPIVDILNGNGLVYWVDSNQGSDGNNGNFNHPFATINYAVTRCNPNVGDKIFVAAGHREIVDAAAVPSMDCNIGVDGITIYFMGEGRNRATIEFTVSTISKVNITGSNVTLVNPRFLASVDGIVEAITVTGANVSMENVTYVDGINIDTTIALAVRTAALNFKLNGWKYIAGNEGGTQKTSNIVFDGTINAQIINVEIAGDFSDANMSDFVSPSRNLILENIILRNTNTSPAPGLILQPTTAGQAKNIDIRIESGTNYVSNVARMNWDFSCLGYNADGYTGDLIGTAPSTSIEGKIDLIQADVGDASARTNFPSIETMIGIPDAANSNLDDIIRTGYDSSSIAQNADGSVLERLEYLQEQIIPDVAGLIFSGSCDAGMVASQTSIVCAHLSGYGDSVFNLRYYIQVIKNANSIGAAPEGEVRQVTAYTSATGTFTTAAFSVNVEANDKILLIHESLIIPGRNDIDNAFDSSLVAPNADGSLIEREEYIQTQVATLDTNLGDPSGDTLTSITAKLGNGATTVTADLLTANTNIGDASGDTLTSIVDKLGDGATTVTADLGTLQTNVGDPSGDTLISLTAKLGDGATTVTADLGTLKTNVGDASGDTLTSVVAKLGDGATTVTADLTTANTNIGDASGDTLKSIVAKLGNGATTVAADFGTVISDTSALVTNVGDPSGDTLKSLTAKLGDGATTTTADLGTLKTNVGDASGDTLKSVVAKLGNGTTTINGDLQLLKDAPFCWMLKVVYAPNITFAAPFDITLASTGGPLYIEDVLLMTDPVGLATGTNVKILIAGNTYGTSTVCEETVANLGSSVSIDLDAMSVSHTRTMLETGKKLQIQSTIADCTGAGFVVVLVKFVKIGIGSSILPA